MWFRAAIADKRENKANGGERRSWANKATMGRVARHEIPKAGTSEEVDRSNPRDGLEKVRPKKSANRGVEKGIGRFVERRRPRRRQCEDTGAMPERGLIRFQYGDGEKEWESQGRGLGRG